MNLENFSTQHFFFKTHYVTQYPILDTDTIYNSFILFDELYKYYN